MVHGMTLLEKFEDWLLVQGDKSAAFAPYVVKRVRFLATHYGLDVDRFYHDAGYALQIGYQVLAARKREGQKSGVKNSRTALNDFAYFAGHKGIYWRPMTKRRRDDMGDVYERSQVERMMSFDVTSAGTPWVLQDFAMAEYNVATGLRRGEVARTQETHVDQDEATYWVMHPTKNGPRRRLKFADPSILDEDSFFMQWLRQRPQSPQNRHALWMHPRTLRPLTAEQVGSRMTLMRRILGFNTSFQRGRAFFATELWMQGMRVPGIQKYLGHASRAVTEHYLHIQFRVLDLELERVKPELPLSSRQHARIGLSAVTPKTWQSTLQPRDLAAMYE